MSTRPATSTSWDEYWRLTPEPAAYKQGGPLDDTLARFWASYFSESLRAARPRSVLDLACGNGAVTRFFFDEADRRQALDTRLVGLDRSLPALTSLRACFPRALAAVSAADRAPFRDGAFDDVVSQFGLEYAGLEAIDEAARLVSPKGRLAAVLHRKEGALYRENQLNQQCMTDLIESGLLATAKAYFQLRFDTDAGLAGRERLRLADEALAAAVANVDRILLNLGEGIAGGVLFRLYSDIAHIYGRTRAFDAKEVREWLDHHEAEANAYAGRISAMLAASLDDEAMQEIARRVEARGLHVRRMEGLFVREHGQAAAWTFVCER